MRAGTNHFAYKAAQGGSRSAMAGPPLALACLSFDFIFSKLHNRIFGTAVYLDIVAEFLLAYPCDPCCAP